MPGKNKECLTSDKVLDMLAADAGATVCPEDSSSDEEDLVYPEKDNSDLDYEIPSSESECDDYDDDDYQPPSSGQASCVQSSSSSPAPQPNTRKRKAPDSSFLPKRALGDSVVQEEKWHNREEEDIRPQPLQFLPLRKPGPICDSTTPWSPLSLFQLFFSPSVVRTLIENTNANAARRLKAGLKFVWTALTVSDFYIFMAIIIFTSLVNVNHRADYWRKMWPYNFPFPADKMTRDRFEAILWSLHLSNPNEDEENEKKRNTADYDRLFKIKPLYTDMVTACQDRFQPYQTISIDEHMVGFKARHSVKRYPKDRPTKWGYKLFVLADSSTGFIWNFFVCTGKSVSVTGQGLSSSSVLDLLPSSLLGGGYTLFVDNVCTSPTLFQDLSAKNIGCCGTVRKNGIGFPKTAENDLPKKAERGDLRWLRKDGMLFVKWMDTREVTMCSTVHAAFSGKCVKRRVKTAGVWETRNIPVPDAVVDYNKNMGGVDLSNALTGSVSHKSTKWYKTFFYHFIDIATINSFILHKELLKVKKKADSGKPLSYKQFKEQLAAEMLEFAGSKSAAPPEPQPQPQPKNLTCMPEYYGSDATQSRRQCRYCQKAGIPKVKTPVYCRRCQVPLCFTSKKNCFRKWHDARS